MTPNQVRNVSKLLSYHLRHAPGELNLTLDPGGWVKTDDLLNSLKTHRRVTVTLDDLIHVVENNDKNRFSFSDDKAKIRANQGHSVEVDLQLEEKEPPEFLYHGTAEKNLMAIYSDGLRKMNRNHVHLSSDQETAKKVGGRHGKPVVLTVETGKMHWKGHKFYCSDNGVWLTESVPAEYLRMDA